MDLLIAVSRYLLNSPANPLANSSLFARLVSTLFKFVGVTYLDLEGDGLCDIYASKISFYLATM